MLILLFILTLISFAIIFFKVYSSLTAFAGFFAEGAKRYSWIKPEQVYFKEFQEAAAAANKMVQERHETEAALKEGTERLNLTLGATGIGIWERDLLKKTITWDKAAQSILGLSMDPLIGHREIFLARPPG